MKFYKKTVNFYLCGKEEVSFECEGFEAGEELPARYHLIRGEGHAGHGKAEVLQVAGQSANLANIQPVFTVHKGIIIEIKQLKLISNPEINWFNFIDYILTYFSRMMISSAGSTLFKCRQLNCLKDAQLVKLQHLQKHKFARKFFPILSTFLPAH